MPRSSIIQYDMCIKCKVNIAKLGLYYCFYCKPRDKDSQNCKIYFYKFKNKHSKSRLLLKNEVYHKDLSLCIEPVDFGSCPPLSNNQLFSLPTWEKFRSFAEFANFVIKSDRISFSYFIVSCIPLIQNIPKFQKFIESRSIELPPICSPPNFLLPAPMSKPLQVLNQSSFWNDLLKFYFQELHPISPLFSIKSFNPKTASPYLMSAIYYGAYCFGSEQPDEIADYMEKFAENCIKKIVKTLSIDNIRALVIFTQLYQWNGEYTLAKTLQGHMSRMSYALGLHLDCKKLSPIERYNRQLLFSAVKIVNVCISGSHGFAPNYLTESCNSDLSLIDSKWQLPDSSCAINFDSDVENILYSLVITEFYNFSDKLNYIIWFPNFMDLSVNSFNQMWNKKLSNLKNLIESTVNSFNQMKVQYIEMEESITDHICKVKMLYHDASLELYELFKHKHETLSRRNISTILEHCHCLFETVVECSNYNPYYQYYAHILGLHYLNVYPKCNPAQKTITKQKLSDLLIYMKSKYFSYYSLNYLLLKTGYDSIEE